LIRIPQSSDFDPFELQKYRNKFIPQEYEYKNQTELRKYSNNLIEGLHESYSLHKNQCEVDKFLRSFCTRHNVNYENHRYDLLLKAYCMSILPFRRPSRDDKRQIEGVREGMYSKCKTGSDFMQVNSFEEIDGVKIFGVSHKERQKLEENRREINRVEALRTWRFSEFGVAMRSVESFNRMIRWKGEIQEYNQSVNADSE
jgi:hypothetical protein